MGRRAGTLLGTVAALALLGALLAAPGAQADFGIANWEAGTCKTDTPECTYESDRSQFYTQAAGHPPAGITDFKVNTNLLGQPEGTLAEVRVDLPVGLNVNPRAVPQCPKEEFEANPANCEASRVGTSYVTAISELLPVQLPFPVYSLVPDFGSPGLWGFKASLGPGPLDFGNVYLVGDIDWAGDYHQGFTISTVPAVPPLIRSRLVFEGTKGNSFLTLPSACNGDTTSSLRLTAADGATDFAETTPAGPGNIVPIDGCEDVPFEPGVSASAGAVTDSPAAVSVDVTVPQSSPTNPMEVNSSTVRRARVSLPQGLGLNPAAAPRLQFCTDAQFGKGTENPVACPAPSRIGTVSIQTPVLPPDSLTGPVYLGEQLSRDPESGNQYRIFINAASERYGVDVRLVGNVIADARTGRLTTVVSDAPQATFSSLTVRFDGGDTATLTSPPVCGPNTTQSSISPWSGGPDATPAHSFALTSAPGGAPCAPSMAARPFAPGFAAAPNGNRAKAFEPFAVHLTRPPGQQELKGVDITLPAGATARLKGVPYCPPAAIAAAAQRSGADELANPSCPVASRVGVASTLAGTGPAPLRIDGTVYLAGPTRGAPLSLAVITPALAGPFDLGVVVVRVPLFVHPQTARITAVAEIPDVFGGAKLSIRSIFLTLNRPNFTLNGTSCRPGAVGGVLRGGGADPAVPASFSRAPVSAPYRSGGCRRLRFKPKLSLRLFGATKRDQNPRLRAVLRARTKDANIRRTVVALPHALFLDQASLETICTRVQFAAGDCPRRSRYGRARAFTPLLDEPLEGPVYLRSSDNLLPDLVAHLEGQVDIDLVAKIDSFRGGIRTTFASVPDVPVSRFVMNLRGGKRGLLVASRNLCRKPVRGLIRIKGQNGRKANKKVKLRTPCDKKRDHGRRGGSKR